MPVFNSRLRLEDFESAALPHLDDIYRTAVHPLRDANEAEDLAQDVYLQAWKSFDRFQPGTNCRAWLFQILFHRLHHHRRKWFPMRFMERDEHVLENAAPYEPPVPEELTDKEVLAALEKVPQDFREVLLLTDVHELSYKEAAAALGIPVGTVMSRLSRGRKALRNQLSGYAQSFGLKNAKAEGESE